MSDFNLSVNPEDPLIKHALRGTSFAVVRLEELNEIVHLKADAVACYRPANSQELFAVERIALCQQAIFLGHRLEAGSSPRLLITVSRAPAEPSAPCSRIWSAMAIWKSPARKTATMPLAKAS